MPNMCILFCPGMWIRSDPDWFACLDLNFPDPDPARIQESNKLVKRKKSPGSRSRWTLLSGSGRDVDSDSVGSGLIWLSGFGIFQSGSGSKVCTKSWNIFIFFLILIFFLFFRLTLAKLKTTLCNRFFSDFIKCISKKTLDPDPDWVKLQDPDPDWVDQVLLHWSDIVNLKC